MKSEHVVSMVTRRMALLFNSYVRTRTQCPASAAQVKKDETCGEKDKCVQAHYIGSHNAFCFT